MKKLICLLIVLAMMLTLVACGEKKDDRKSRDDADDEDTADMDFNFANEENDDSHSGEITVAKVENAPVTDASKFDYREVDGGIAITDFTGDDTIVVIPDEIDGKPVVAIGDNAFINNETLLGLKLGNNVQDIGSMAFVNCTSLRVFISGASLLTISEKAFLNCQQLSEVRLNEGLKSLELLCFGAVGLRELYIPGTVESIEAPYIKCHDGQVLKIISTPGSAAEDYVALDGEDFNIIFEAIED